MKKMCVLAFILCGFSSVALSQEPIAQPNQRFTPQHYQHAQTIAEADSIFDAFFKGKKKKKGDGSKHYQIWRKSALERADQNGVISKNWSTSIPGPYRNLLAKPAAASTPSWTAIGPFSWDKITNQGWNPGVGRINGLTEDPKNSNILYASTPWGGLWKSTNAGVSWINITDNYGIVGCSDLVVDHQNSNVLYLLTGDRDGDYNGNGVWKSMDGGVTWAQTNHNQTSSRGYHLRMHGTNNQILVVADDSGVFVTKDAGATWSQIPGFYSVDDIEFLPGSPNLLFIIVNNTLKSYDVSSGAIVDVNGLPTTIGRAQIAISAAAPNRLYISGGGLDGTVGIWWYEFNTKQLIQKNTGSVNMQGYDRDLGDPGQYWYNFAFAVSPLDANKVYYGAINVWFSNDGGTSFTKGCGWNEWYLCDNYTHADIHGIYTFGNRIYTVSDGGVYRSTDHMTTTQDITKGMNITMFYNFGHSPQNRNAMIGGTQDNGVYATMSGTWTTIAGADAYGGFVDRTNQDIMYYAYSSTIRSTNGFRDGTSTATTAISGIEITEMDQSPTDPNLMIGTGLGSNTGIYRSTNRGQDWTLILSGNFKSPFFVNSSPSVAWALNTNGKVYRSTNAGLSWTSVSTGLPTAEAGALSVDPSNDQVAWVVYTGTRSDKVYKTITAGASWFNYTGNLSEAMTSLAAGGQGNGDVYAGSNKGVFYRDNSMTTWIPWNSGLPQMRVMQLYTHLQDKKLRAVTWGRGIWEADLRATSTSSSSSMSSSSISSSSSSSQTVPIQGYKILFKQEGGLILVQRSLIQGQFGVALYDAAGKLVREASTANGIDYQIHLAQLPVGQYVLRIRDANEQYGQRVHIQ